ncbi:MAG TPA: type IV toxin-antitoxin system AbiEi family antitoxin [Ignavibacteriaceae bacterium]|nr:type IV toxin-antitoxin system AbiEi family antitoxin [Ignavibacteriaceae bacterium]
MKDRLIYTVTEKILKEHKIDAIWTEPITKGIDGILTINYKGIKQKFYVEIKKELRNYQLDKIFHQAETYFPLLVLAETIFPNIRNLLKEQKIGYIDLNGNMNIEADNFFLKVEGNHKDYLHPEKHGRAFTKAGLKTILLFLLNEDKINDTYRVIAKDSGIAIGNVKLILDGLIEEGFVLRKNDKALKLTNKKDLLLKWITGYNEKLKPTLLFGNFKFMKADDFNKWKELKIDGEYTCWGGEAAGNIYTGYLLPQTLTLYTNEKKLDLMKKHRLVPDYNGNIKIFERFWRFGLENKKVVPPIIAYADLLETNDRRCIETAQKIYEQHLKNIIE